MRGALGMAESMSGGLGRAGLRVEECMMEGLGVEEMCGIVCFFQVSSMSLSWRAGGA